MLAVRLHDDGLRVEQIETPSPGPGEVLVRVHAAAITRGELEWPVDRLPATPSHELSGVVAGSGEEALEIVKRTELDLVLLDLSMPGMNGVDTFREIHTLRPALPVMIVTAYPDSDLMAKALEIGPFTMISKPVDLAQIQKTVDRIVGT